jgi:hypothetical protein
MTALTHPKPGTRYRCISRVSSACDQSAGHTQRTKCRRCGSALLIEAGWFGVFDWQDDGRYPASRAHELHTHERKARAVCDANLLSDNLVVRFVST